MSSISIQLATIAAYGENEVTEFKKDNEDPRMIVRSISAISNSAAIAGTAFGILVWGIDDKSHEVVGTTFNPNVAKIAGQEICCWINQHIQPRLAIHFESISYNGTHCVILRVPAAFRSPTLAATVGKDNKTSLKAFIRIGSSTKILQNQPENERLLWSRLMNEHPEDEFVLRNLTAKEIWDVLDIPAFAEFVELTEHLDENNFIDFLTEHHLAVQTGLALYSLPLYAVILAARQFNKIPSLVNYWFRILVHQGTSTTSPISKDVIFEQGLALCFKQCLNLVKDNAPRAEFYRASSGKRVIEASPELALRELLANALIHQDLSCPDTHITVEIFSDRITFTNPGSLLVKEQRILDAPPKCRNENLAKWMRLSHQAESRGSGWDYIVGAVENACMPAPEIDTSLEGITRVTLWIARPLNTMTAAQKDWMVYLHTVFRKLDGTGTASNATLRKRLGLSDAQASVISKLYKHALQSGLIAIEDESAGLKFKRYVPFWAHASANGLAGPLGEKHVTASRKPQSLGTAAINDCV